MPSFVALCTAGLYGAITIGLPFIRLGAHDRPDEPWAQQMERMERVCWRLRYGEECRKDRLILNLCAGVCLTAFAGLFFSPELLS